MKILALDTTQEYCSVALMIDDRIIYREELTPRTHTNLILPQVESVLDEADTPLRQLDAIAFGRGPGSFTGLRIAAGVAQGLALGADLPVIAVSSLAAMAQGVYREQHDAMHICAAFDARIGEIYWGCYQLTGGIMSPVTEEAVDTPEDLYLPGSNQWLAIGAGWAAYPVLQQLHHQRLAGLIIDSAPLARDIIPIATSMLKNGEAVDAAQAIPVYLRQKVARTVAERNAAEE
jgi:tRNA threonylcarbamoyladenosine biosynthesis protein TsaB